MSKYVLKKDLPFAKKGKILNFVKSSLDQENFYLNDGSFLVSDAGLQKLIDDGWIEEVKEDTVALCSYCYNKVNPNVEIKTIGILDGNCYMCGERIGRLSERTHYIITRKDYDKYFSKEKPMDKCHKGDEPKIKKPREFELYIDGLNLVEANMFSKDIGTRLNFAKECNPITLQRVKVREVIK